MKSSESRWIPRFLSDSQLRRYFGLSERAFRRLRMTGNFPPKDPLVGKTDRVAVDRFFDWRSGLTGEPPVVDGEENWEQPPAPQPEEPSAIEAYRRAMTMDEFCKAVGISRTLAYEEIKSGRLRTRKLGRRTLVLIDDAESWLASLPDARR